MNVNGCDSPCIGQKEIDRTSFRRIGWRQVEQTTRTGAGPDGAPAGDPSSPPGRPDVTARGSRAWFRGENEGEESVRIGESEGHRWTSSEKRRAVPLGREWTGIRESLCRRSLAPLLPTSLLLGRFPGEAGLCFSSLGVDAAERVIDRGRFRVGP